MMIEHLGQISVFSDADEYRLVRRDGVLAIVHVYFHREDPEHRAWLERVAAHGTQWIGFEHPHVVPVIDIQLGERLVAVTGDERGQDILVVAQMIQDLPERETWALSELAGIAEGIARMQSRDQEVALRRADKRRMIVGADGHARLRAPLSEIRRPGTVDCGICWPSPEQLSSSKQLTQASHVFQLAAVAYAALASKAGALKWPFEGETELEMLCSLRDGKPPPPPPATDARIAELILSNLARDPAARMRDLGQFAAALRELVGTPSSELLAKVAALRSQWV